MTSPVSAKFYDSFNNPGQIVRIKDKTFAEQLQVKSFNYDCGGVLFTDCVFKNDLFFEGIDLKSGLLFRNCKFKKSLDLRACQAHEENAEISPNAANITLDNCEVGVFICTQDCKFSRGLSINNNCQISSLTLDGLAVLNGQLSMKNSQICSLDLANIDVKLSVILSDCDITGQVRFSNVKSSDYSLTKSSFARDLYFWNGETNNIIINESLCKDDVKIEALKCVDSLTVFGTEFKKSVAISYFDKNQKIIGGPNCFNLDSAKANELLVNGFLESQKPSQITEIKVRSSLSLKGEFRFSGLTINRFNLTGVNKNSGIYFDYCQFHEIDIREFINFGNLHFQNIRSTSNQNSSILIQNSNLGRAHFFNAFLNEFGRVNIYDTVLSEIVTSRVRWFSNLNEVSGSGIPDWIQIRDIFRQLKLSSEKQSDRVQSLVFKKNEMNALYQQLKLSKSIFNSDRLIMCLNRSNDYGLNWIKPIILILCTTVVFFCFIVISISETLTFYPSFNINDIANTLTELLQNANAIPQLLNPAHILERIFPNHKSFSFLTHSLDFAYRLILAYLIFQTISAFRKFIK